MIPIPSAALPPSFLISDASLSFPDHCETTWKAFSDIQEILGEGMDKNKVKDFPSMGRCKDLVQY